MVAELNIGCSYVMLHVYIHGTYIHTYVKHKVVSADIDKTIPT